MSSLNTDAPNGQTVLVYSDDVVKNHYFFRLGAFPAIVPPAHHAYLGPAGCPADTGVEN